MDKIMPVFASNAVTVAFASDENFVPYMSVMICSIVDHSSLSRNYDIIILHRNISSSSQQLLSTIIADRPNFSIRFLDVSASIDSFQLYTGGKSSFTVDCYLRLLIPGLLSEHYHKVLYLDGDMVAMTDIAALYDEDVTGYLLGSTRDLIGLSLYYDPGEQLRRYRDKVLKLKKPDDYFVDGMLLLNLDEFRKAITTRELLQLASSRNWLQHDQDVLNVLCDGGKARLLDESWQVLNCPHDPSFLPPELYGQYLAAYHAPKIIHFGGELKPWRGYQNIYPEEFWKAAAHSPFYLEIIQRAFQDARSQGSHLTANELYHEVEVRSYQGIVGLKVLLRFILGWFTFKLHKAGLIKKIQIPQHND